MTEIFRESYIGLIKCRICNVETDISELNINYESIPIKRMKILRELWIKNF